MEQEWAPTEEDIEFTKEQVEGLRIGGVWAPQGLEYERIDDSALKLHRFADHPAATEAHRRISLVLKELNWDVYDDEAQPIELAEDPREAMFQERLRQQEIAMRWTCSNGDCEQKLADMDLEGGLWTNLGVQAFMAPDGTTTEEEHWTVKVACDTCEQIMMLEPYDYGLLIGDENFFRYVSTEGIEYLVLTREQTIELVDGGNINKCTPLGTIAPCSGDVLPPHMRGTFCIAVVGDEEE
jgi:hypothetical protein